MNILYKVHTRHKHSVRITPSPELNPNYDNLRLPDIYVTHDLLDLLGVKPNGNFTLLVSFNNTTPRRPQKETNPEEKPDGDSV